MAIRSYVQTIISPQPTDRELRKWANAVTLVRTAVNLFRLEWLILDAQLSNQLLRWANLPPSYYYVVDSVVGWLNWSRLAFSNLGVVSILPLASGSIWAAAPVLVALSSAKIYSAARRCRLPLSEG